MKNNNGGKIIILFLLYALAVATLTALSSRLSVAPSQQRSNVCAILQWRENLNNFNSHFSLPYKVELIHFAIGAE
jgi:hypothetical protein